MVTHLVKFSCILQVFSKFPDLQKAVSLHLVEISPQLSKMQRKKLAGGKNPIKDDPSNKKFKEVSNSDSCMFYESCVSHHRINVHWYKQLRDVPSGPMFLVAHEFLDALPVHKFQVC